MGFALKVTGVGPREVDDKGRPVHGVQRKGESWILGVQEGETLGRWLLLLKGAVGARREAETQREMSWRSSDSGKSTASGVSRLFEADVPAMERRPSLVEQSPASTSSMSPPMSRSTPASRKTSGAGVEGEHQQMAPKPRVLLDEMGVSQTQAAHSHLYINAELPSPPLLSATEHPVSDEEDDLSPETAHPYRMALSPPPSRPTTQPSPSQRLSSISSPPRLSERSSSFASSSRRNRDSTSLSSLSSRTTSSSHKHPPRAPPPTVPLPLPPPDLLPRSTSEPTHLLTSNRHSVMSTSTTTSSTSSSSLRSRLSGAPLPPQLAPPAVALGSLPLPPTPSDQLPFGGGGVAARQRMSMPPRSVSEPRPRSGKGEGEGEGRDERGSPAFAMRALPPPPPSTTATTAPVAAETIAPSSVAVETSPSRVTIKASGSVRDRISKWEQK